MKKPVCNHSSKSHFVSARSKYRRARLFCVLADLAALAITFIIVPEARFYWLAAWTPALSYVSWRYWIRLGCDGYFECDECRKLKHARHIKEFADSYSGDRFVWCDVCLPEMRVRARAMRSIRLIIAKILRDDRAESQRQKPIPYVPMPKPALNDPKVQVVQPEPKIVIAFPRPAGEDIPVSSPRFSLKH